MKGFEFINHYNEIIKTDIYNIFSVQNVGLGDSHITALGEEKYIRNLPNADLLKKALDEKKIKHTGFVRFVGEYFRRLVTKAEQEKRRRRSGKGTKQAKPKKNRVETVDGEDIDIENIPMVSDSSKITIDTDTGKGKNFFFFIYIVAFLLFLAPTAVIFVILA